MDTWDSSWDSSHHFLELSRTWKAAVLKLQDSFPFRMCIDHAHSHCFGKTCKDSELLHQSCM